MHDIAFYFYVRGFPEIPLLKVEIKGFPSLGTTNACGSEGVKIDISLVTELFRLIVF